MGYGFGRLYPGKQISVDLKKFNILFLACLGFSGNVRLIRCQDEYALLLDMTLVRSLCFIRKCRGLSSWTHRLPRNAPLDIHPEVKYALTHQKPVVALETALVTHGLPYPMNLDVPLALEEVVRSTGSIPATIGIIQGRVKIGLEKHELERLAEKRMNPVKISRRDIAAAIATGSDGGSFSLRGLFFSFSELAHRDYM